MSLLNFHGRECPHCRAMDPLIDAFEKKTGQKVERLEVWHDQKNMEILNQYDKNLCGGVPFFYNTGTGAWICGEATAEELEAWAAGS